MLTWLQANLVNIVIIAIIVLACYFAISGMIRDRKAGKSSCGGNCSGCSGCGGSCGTL